MRARIVFTPVSDGQQYEFSGSLGQSRWPTDPSALAPGGMWNWLWRLGYSVADPEPVTGAACKSSNLLLCALASLPEPEIIAALLARGRSGLKTIVTGTPAVLSGAFGFPVLPQQPRGGFCFAGLTDRPEFIAPSRTTLFADPGRGGIGTVLGVAGETHSPARAALAPVPDAPVAVALGSLIVLNGDPFAAYQGWLQGHFDLGPWLNWRPRLLWLDDYAVALARVLNEIAPGILDGLSEAQLDLPLRTLVLRHDLDSSRNTAFIEIETASGAPATHALLDDRNLEFWLREIEARSGHEAAFHYDSAHKPSVLARVERRLRRGPVLPILADRRRVAAGGLAQQLARVRRRGLRPVTLHRHLSFIYYPETIDAMHYLDSEIIGSSSFFRGRVLRFGADPDDINGGETVAPPDPQFPSWFPFRTWHATARELSRKFEGTCLMEPDPEVVEAVLGSSDAGHLRRVVTVCMHPAHADTDAMYPGGTRARLESFLRTARARDWRVSTLADVYRKCLTPC